jgi:hypothetical protein
MRDDIRQALAIDAVADLPASATVTTDPAERRLILADFVDDFNQRDGPGSQQPGAVLDD